MRRRDFITVLSGAAIWPLAVYAQQPAMPVVGFLGVTSAGTQPYLIAFRQGLSETGYVEGQNVVIEYRWTEDRYNRLPELTADLIRHHVNVIVTLFATSAAVAAKATTTTIPIVFSIGDDPVKHGLVASLSQPGGNATGINFFSAEVTAKRLGLLRELLPKATRIGVLVNPTHNVEITERTVKDVNAAADPLGLQIEVVNAGNGNEIDAAFKTLVNNRADGLLVGPDAFFISRRVQIAILAARHMMPAIYTIGDYAEAGGLISYGTDIPDSLRQQGVYVGRILKGTKPTDLPVLQSTKFKFIINLRTAKALGLEVPATLVSRADEVIE
jgi:putative ABC transport system substrate-binding protein